MPILLLVLGLVIQTPAGPRPLPFSDKAWALRGDGTAISRVDGRDALDVRTGFGFRRDVRLEDGTIEFDVKLTDARSFVYLYFRAESDGEREEVYLRPHKSMLPDALQYAPVWQDSSAWQLYHGPGGTAATSFDAGVWTRVKLVVQGRSAALFVGDMNRPAMIVPRMAREPRADRSRGDSPVGGVAGVRAVRGPRHARASGGGAGHVPDRDRRSRRPRAARS